MLRRMSVDACVRPREGTTVLYLPPTLSFSLSLSRTSHFKNISRVPWERTIPMQSWLQINGNAAEVELEMTGHTG